MGSKIRFVNPLAGYDPDIATARKHLTVGKVYTLTRKKVHGWNTEYWLKGIPGISFNSTMFEPAGDDGTEGDAVDG